MDPKCVGTHSARKSCQNPLLCSMARAARENSAEICATTGNNRRRSHTTGNLAASGLHNCGPVARHSRLTFASHAVQSAWLMVPLACTVHSMAFHHSLRRMLASAQLHVCGAVVPCFVQSTALYLTPCSQLLNASETREAEAQSK